jgi:hypothetical protein
LASEDEVLNDQHADRQHPVDLRQVDLPALRLGRVADLEARQKAELHRLLRQREGTGDHGLAGDDGGKQRERDEGHEERFGRQRVERAEVLVRHGGRVLQDQRALAEIVDDERGKHQAEPGGTNRVFAEMAHVGVERLGPGHREEHRAQNDQPDHPVVREEVGRVVGIERVQDLEIVADMHEAEDRERDEPHQHDRPEPGGDLARPAALHREQADQDK